MKLHKVLMVTAGMALLSSTSVLAYTGGVGSDTASVNSLTDAASFVTDYGNASLASAIGYYVSGFAEIQNALGSAVVTSFQGYNYDNDSWGHEYYSYAAVNRGQQSMNRWADGGNASQSAAATMQSASNIKTAGTFTYGTLASNALTSSSWWVSQRLETNFSGHIHDLVATVSGGTVSYSATLDWQLTGWFQAYKDPQGTRSVSGSFSEVDSMTVQLGSFPTLSTPGPIAGAGLPVLLGLAGFGAWRRRRAAA